jgi:hypothetical protein
MKTGIYQFSAVITLAMGLMVGSVVARAALPDPNDPHWECYSALPGHPTNAEKSAFVQSTAPPAQAAERGGGPPAAGLLAMSALESGFGFTRTALFASNLFGWKFTGPAAAEGRKAWVLTCQPASDPNNNYIVFHDAADSVAFVAGRLTKLARYAAITQKYHTDRAAGMAIDDAVGSWVTRIAAAGYNPLKGYPAQVLSIANNFMHPETTVSEEYSLYRFSMTDATDPTAPPAVAHAAEAAAPIDSAAAHAAEAILHQKLLSSRYMLQHCDPQPITDWPDYSGRAVTRCQYSVTSNGKTLSALVYLLNPSEANIVTRIAGACNVVGFASNPGCGRRLANLIIGQNGGQFPVAGFVIERKQDAGGQGPDPVYLEFRDGNTITSTDHLNFSDRQLKTDAMEHAARAPIAETRRIARIANATRDDYYRAGGKEPVGTSPADDHQNHWPAVIRANELRAQDTGNDDLLRGVAMGMGPKLGQD